MHNRWIARGPFRGPAKVPAQLADLIYVSSLPQIREPRNRAALEAMVRNFSSDPVRYRHSIHELLDDDRDAFLTNVVRILKSDTDSRAVQYLLALLVSENLLYDALCDPALNLDQARAVARLAARVDRSDEHTSELQSLRHLVCR